MVFNYISIKKSGILISVFFILGIILVSIVLSQIGHPQKRISIHDLPLLIQDMDLQKGIKTSLLAKAENAIKAVESENTQAAVNQLNAMIGEIRALSDKKIPHNDAAFLIMIIQKIIDFYSLPTCCLNGAVTIDDSCFGATLEQCTAIGGIILQCVPFGQDKGKAVGRPAPAANVSLRPANLTRHGDILENISRLFNASRIGIPPYGNGTYVNRTHDCDDFANETERYFQGLGFTATFTVYWCYSPPPFGHCVADFHLGDGSTLFISPYTGLPEDLDFDGDGTVEARNHHEARRVLTDDNCEIEIYPDRAAAEAAGVVID